MIVATWDEDKQRWVGNPVPEVELHVNDEFGNVSNNSGFGKPFEDRRPILVDHTSEENKAHVYLGGFNQYHADIGNHFKLPKHPYDYPYGAYFPHGSNHWNRLPGDVQWFGGGLNEDWREAVEKALGAQTAKPEDWSFEAAVHPYSVVEGSRPGYDEYDFGRRPIVRDIRDNTLYLGQQGVHHGDVEDEFSNELEPRGDDHTQYPGMWGRPNITNHYDLLSDGSVSGFLDTPEEDKLAMAQALKGYHHDIRDDAPLVPAWEFQAKTADIHEVTPNGIEIHATDQKPSGARFDKYRHPMIYNPGQRKLWIGGPGMYHDDAYKHFDIPYDRDMTNIHGTHFPLGGGPGAPNRGEGATYWLDGDPGADAVREINEATGGHTPMYFDGEMSHEPSWEFNGSWEDQDWDEHEQPTKGWKWVYQTIGNGEKRLGVGTHGPDDYTTHWDIGKSLPGGYNDEHIEESNGIMTSDGRVSPWYTNEPHHTNEEIIEALKQYHPNAMLAPDTSINHRWAATKVQVNDEPGNYEEERRPIIYNKGSDELYVGGHGQYHNNLYDQFGLDRNTMWDQPHAHGGWYPRGAKWYKPGEITWYDDMDQDSQNRISEALKGQTMESPGWNFNSSENEPQGVKIVSWDQPYQSQGRWDTGFDPARRPIVYSPHHNTVFIGGPGEYHDNVIRRFDPDYEHSRDARKGYWMAQDMSHDWGAQYHKNAIGWFSGGVPEHVTQTLKDQLVPKDEPEPQGVQDSWDFTAARKDWYSEGTTEELNQRFRQLPPWQPGNWGKAVTNDEGHAITWNDQDGLAADYNDAIEVSPHHGQALRSYPELRNTICWYIEPDGSAQSSYGSRRDDVNTIQTLQAKHPEIHMKGQEPEAWNFNASLDDIYEPHVRLRALPSWKPGTWGKGITTDKGQVRTWSDHSHPDDAVQRSGDNYAVNPHHWEIYESHPHLQSEDAQYWFIDPDGGAKPSYSNGHRPGEGLSLLQSQHPEIYPREESSSEWTFNAAAYGDGVKDLPSWTPGTWGKAITNDQGNVRTWSDQHGHTDDASSNWLVGPHHSQMFNMHPELFPHYENTQYWFIDPDGGAMPSYSNDIRAGSGLEMLQAQHPEIHRRESLPDERQTWNFDAKLSNWYDPDDSINVLNAKARALPSWQPGTWGKAITTRDGEVRTWSDQDAGDYAVDSRNMNWSVNPHHGHMDEAYPELGRPRQYWFIEPDGQAKIAYGGDEDNGLELLKAQHPEIHPLVKQPDAWDFNAKRSAVPNVTEHFSEGQGEDPDSRPFIYDVSQDHLHVGQPGNLHWQLIRQSPLLTHIYGDGLEGGVPGEPPGFVYGRAYWPKRQPPVLYNLGSNPKGSNDRISELMSDHFNEPLGYDNAPNADGWDFNAKTAAGQTEGWKWVYNHEQGHGGILPMPTFHNEVRNRFDLRGDTQLGVMGPEGQVEWYGRGEPTPKLMEFLKQTHPEAHPKVNYQGGSVYHPGESEFGWKFAAANEWTPGQFGKYIVTPSGEHHIWGIGGDDFDDRPSHWDYAMSQPWFKDYAQGREDESAAPDRYSVGWINPEGGVSPQYGPENVQKGHQIAQSIGGHIEDEEPWEWESKVYAMSDPWRPLSALWNIKPNRDKGYGGEVVRGFVMPDGQIHSWDTNETGEYHQDAAARLGVNPNTMNRPGGPVSWRMDYLNPASVEIDSNPEQHFPAIRQHMLDQYNTQVDSLKDLRLAQNGQAIVSATDTGDPLDVHDAIPPQYPQNVPNSAFDPASPQTPTFPHVEPHNPTSPSLNHSFPTQITPSFRRAPYEELAAHLNGLGVNDTMTNEWAGLEGGQDHGIADNTTYAHTTYADPHDCATGRGAPIPYQHGGQPIGQQVHTSQAAPYAQTRPSFERGLPYYALRAGPDVLGNDFQMAYHNSAERGPATEDYRLASIGEPEFIDPPDNEFWEPGSYGKAIYSPKSNQFTHWKVDEGFDGYPWHSHMRALLAPDGAYTDPNNPWHTETNIHYRIDPKGAIDSYNYQRPGSAEGMEALIDHTGGHPKPEETDWFQASIGDPREPITAGSDSVKIEEHNNPDAYGLYSPMDDGGPKHEGWGGRLPLIYLKDERTVHVGLPDFTHGGLASAIKNKRQAVNRFWEYPGGKHGWVGYNPEAYGKNQTFDWYGDPMDPEVNAAIANHFGIHQDETPEDMSGWKFGSAPEANMELPEGYVAPDPGDDRYKGLELHDGRKVYWSIYNPAQYKDTVHAALMHHMGIKPEEVAKYVDNSIGPNEWEFRAPHFQQTFVDYYQRMEDQRARERGSNRGPATQASHLAAKPISFVHHSPEEIEAAFDKRYPEQGGSMARGGNQTRIPLVYDRRNKVVHVGQPGYVHGAIDAAAGFPWAEREQKNRWHGWVGYNSEAEDYFPDHNYDDSDVDSGRWDKAYDNHKNFGWYNTLDQNEDPALNAAVAHHFGIDQENPPDDMRDWKFSSFGPEWDESGWTFGKTAEFNAWDYINNPSPDEPEPNPEFFHYDKTHLPGWDNPVDEEWSGRIPILHMRDANGNSQVHVGQPGWTHGNIQSAANHMGNRIDQYGKSYGWVGYNPENDRTNEIGMPSRRGPDEFNNFGWYGEEGGGVPSSEIDDAVANHFGIDRNNAPEDMSQWKFGNAEPAFVHYGPEQMGDKPLSEDSQLPGYEGRKPLVYDESSNTVHVGPPDYSHNDVERASSGSMKWPRVYGWVGYNPEARNMDAETPTYHNFGWYPDYSGTTVPSHVHNAVAKHFGINAEDPPSDMSAWKFGSSGFSFLHYTPEQLRARGGSPMGMGFDGRRPIIYDDERKLFHVGPPNYTHCDLQIATDQPDRMHHEGWVGYNPDADEMSENAYSRMGWYNAPPGDHITQALAEHFGVNPENPPHDVSDWKFGAIGQPLNIVNVNQSGHGTNWEMMDPTGPRANSIPFVYYPNTHTLAYGLRNRHHQPIMQDAAEKGYRGAWDDDDYPGYGREGDGYSFFGSPPKVQEVHDELNRRFGGDDLGQDDKWTFSSNEIYETYEL